MAPSIGGLFFSLGCELASSYFELKGDRPLHLIENRKKITQKTLENIEVVDKKMAALWRRAVEDSEQLKKEAWRWKCVSSGFLVVASLGITLPMVLLISPWAAVPVTIIVLTPLVNRLLRLTDRGDALLKYLHHPLPVYWACQAICFPVQFFSYMVPTVGIVLAAYCVYSLVDDLEFFKNFKQAIAPYIPDSYQKFDDVDWVVKNIQTIAASRALPDDAKDHLTHKTYRIFLKYCKESN